MRDNIAIGASAGLLADGIKLGLNYLLFRLGMTKVVFWQIVATRFLSRQELFKPAAYLIGAAADLSAAAFLGVAFVYILRYTGRDFLWLKGAGFGLLIWAGLLGMILETARRLLPINVSGILVTLLAHLAFGLALAFFAERLGRASRLGQIKS